MKINSEKLFEFVNNLGTDEKVKFKVFFDDDYVTDINWDGENFNWGSGTFTSGMFFDPLVDFEEIIEKDKKIKKIDTILDIEEDEYTDTERATRATVNECILKLDEIIDKINKMEDQCTDYTGTCQNCNN